MKENNADVLGKIEAVKKLSPTVEAILKAEDEVRAKYEAGTFSEGFSIMVLRVMFEKVADPSNWKLAIHSTIKKTDVAIVAAAIRFFAGCSPIFSPIGSGNGPRVRVFAVGYYTAVGA